MSYTLKGDFLEKNYQFVPSSLIPIVQNALNPINESEIKVNSRSSTTTVASKLKSDLKNLMDDIKKGVNNNDYDSHITYWVNTGEYDCRKLISFDVLNQMTQG